MASGHLTQSQMKVISMMVRGDKAVPQSRQGTLLMVNGKRSSTRFTFESLEKKGYVKQNTDGSYNITDSGKSLGKKLGFN